MQTAVIKESLRIAAVITSRLPVVAPTELIIDGRIIPPRVGGPTIRLLSPYLGFSDHHTDSNKFDH